MQSNNTGFVSDNSQRPKVHALFEYHVVYPVLLWWNEEINNIPCKIQPKQWNCHDDKEEREEGKNE